MTDRPARRLPAEAAGPGHRACSASRAAATSRPCSSARLSEDSTTTPIACSRSNLATQIGRPGPRRLDRAVGAQRRHGLLLSAPAFPTHSASVPSGAMWSLVHGITRQESSFDRAAVSHAGARGMMQLMPGTAREQAGKMGVGYDYRPADHRSGLQCHARQRLFPAAGQPVGRQLPARRRQLQCRRRQRPQMGPRLWRPARPTSTSSAGSSRSRSTETRGYVQRVLENSVVYDRLNPTLPRTQPVPVCRPISASRGPADADGDGERRRGSSRRRASPRSAPNMNNCSAPSGRSWSRRSPGRRAMATARENGDYIYGRSGCARSTGGWPTCPR